MTGKLLARGLLAGLLAGVVAFALAYLWGEPQIDDAIAIEEAHAAGHSHGDADEPELVSRGVQATLGLATGMVIYGAAIGGLFALVFATVQGRISAAGARTTSALLALIGFVAVVLVPQLKYPANPPAVGSGDTIGLRTWLFFAMLALSIAAVMIGIGVARRLRADKGAWQAGIWGAAVWLVLTVATMLVLPGVQEVPPDFPADVLWGFRIAMLGVHAILWAGIGLIFGALAERVLEDEQPQHRRAFA